MASLRRQILEALRDRVAGITKAGGYLTDAGKLVLLGETPPVAPDDRETAIAFVIGEDDVDPEIYQGDLGGADRYISIGWTVGIAALATSTMDNPLLAMEDVIHDIKKAVEVTDRTLGGLVAGIGRGSTVPFPREEGSQIVGSVVNYVIFYSEQFGNPEFQT